MSEAISVVTRHWVYMLDRVFKDEGTKTFIKGPDNPYFLLDNQPLAFYETNIPNHRTHLERMTVALRIHAPGAFKVQFQWSFSNPVIEIYEDKE